MKSVYRRPLPDGLVSFASAEGRVLFREALGAGHMEGFFALAEQFHTQAEPEFCGLASLVVVLNALGVDPGRLWKGPWRWYSEELLDCCASLERVRQRGVTLDQVACLARCNGAEVVVRRAGEAEGSIEALRAVVRDAASGVDGPVVVASYDRQAIGQTGTGHFSPLGGYHAARDLVLVLDVARFKYPPHWVPIERLHAAMRSVDPVSKAPRGWIALTRSPSSTALVFCASARDGGDALVEALFAAVPARVAAASAPDARSALAAFAAAVAERAPLVEARVPLAPEHAAGVDAVRAALGATAVRGVVAAALPPGADADLVAALALAAPEGTWAGVAGPARAELEALLEAGRRDPTLGPEIGQMVEQLEAIARVAAP